MFEYFAKIKEILDKVEKYESENILATKDLLVEASINKKNIFIFGASHAGILTQEMFYRAGGLINVNPIFAKELSLDNEPITMTSKMERLQGYGKALADKTPFNEGDLLILHSVSGRNPVTVELGLEAKKLGVKIVAITNLTYTKTVKSRDASGKLLYEIADVVIDNHGVVGDAIIEIQNTDLTVAPSSTVIGASILNNIVALTVQELTEKNIENLPVFYSANIDGGDEKNKKAVEHYKENIHYKF